MTELRVLHYDRDQKGVRQVKNSAMLSEALPGGVRLINVCHLKSFSGVVGLEDMLLDDPLPFDVAIVNGCSPDAYRVLESVKAGLELNSLSPSRIIYLCPDGSVSDNGVRAVPVGSNGYFVNSKNARQVVDRLVELSKVNSSESGPGFVMY
ncbi:MAG: hypothetical protein V1645_04590 [archaeon]